MNLDTCRYWFRYFRLRTRQSLLNELDTTERRLHMYDLSSTCAAYLFLTRIMLGVRRRDKLKERRYPSPMQSKIGGGACST